MFKRKLTALQHPNPDNFFINSKLSYAVNIILPFVYFEFIFNKGHRSHDQK